MSDPDTDPNVPRVPPQLDDPRLRRIRFRAWHRGMKEMDFILGRFADKHLAAMGAVDIARFEALLEMSDPDLYNWFSGREAMPEAHDHPLTHRIIEFNRTLQEPGQDAD